jgi:hypothetical protein
MACHDATVLAMTTLLSWWWFTNYIATRDLVVAFVIVSCSLGGVVVIVWEQVAAPESSIAFAGHSASGLDPGL